MLVNEHVLHDKTVLYVLHLSHGPFLSPASRHIKNNWCLDSGFINGFYGSIIECVYISYIGFLKYTIQNSTVTKDFPLSSLYIFYFLHFILIITLNQVTTSRLKSIKAKRLCASFHVVSGYAIAPLGFKQIVVHHCKLKIFTRK